MIKWLTNLEKGKQVVALVLIALASVFIMFKAKDKQVSDLQEAYRKELIIRTDSCTKDKERAVAEVNAKYEAFLKGQINKFEDAQKRLDSTSIYNKNLINKNKKIINKLKS